MSLWLRLERPLLESHWHLLYCKSLRSSAKVMRLYCIAASALLQTSGPLYCKIHIHNNPSLFVMQPEIKAKFSYPALSEGAEVFLEEWLQSHQPDRENWLAGLLHEPILRRMLATLMTPSGLPPLEMLDRVVGREEEIQVSAQHLKSCRSVRGDPLMALCVLIEEIAALAFIEDGFVLFGTRYQAEELDKVLQETLARDRHPSHDNGGSIW